MRKDVVNGRTSGTVTRAAVGTTRCVLHSLYQAPVHFCHHHPVTPILQSEEGEFW